MPPGVLRRKDREMGEAEAEALLSQALVGRIGTVGPEGMPYVLPVSFYFDPSSQTVYLHHATRGHLLENLAFSPSTCFEVDEPGPIVATGTTGCNIGQVYRSVICFGRATIIADRKEKEDILRLLVDKYSRQLSTERWGAQELEKLDGTTVIAIKVEIMTGKQRPPIQASS